jgi:hypothetical protein
MGHPVTLKDGQRGEVVRSDGDHTFLLCPFASPPGSTVLGTLDGIAHELQLKVKNCKRQGDAFLIEGRLRNASREARERLTSPAPDAP